MIDLAVLYDSAIEPRRSCLCPTAECEITFSPWTLASLRLMRTSSTAVSTGFDGTLVSIKCSVCSDNFNISMGLSSLPCDGFCII